MVASVPQVESQKRAAEQIRQEEERIARTLAKEVCEEKLRMSEIQAIHQESVELRRLPRSANDTATVTRV